MVYFRERKKYTFHEVLTIIKRTRGQFYWYFGALHFHLPLGGEGELSQMWGEGEEDKGQSFYKVKHDLKLP